MRCCRVWQEEKSSKKGSVLQRWDWRNHWLTEGAPHILIMMIKRIVHDGFTLESYILKISNTLNLWFLIGHIFKQRNGTNSFIKTFCFVHECNNLKKWKRLTKDTRVRNICCRKPSTFWILWALPAIKQTNKMWRTLTEYWTCSTKKKKSILELRKHWDVLSDVCQPSAKSRLFNCGQTCSC